MEKNPKSQLAKTIVDFYEVILIIIRYVMITALIGIFALISSTISNLGVKLFYLC